MAAPTLESPPPLDTSLDTRETTVPPHEEHLPTPIGLQLRNPKPPRPDYALEPPTTREAAFRHASWRADRQRVWDALVRTDAGANRLERFACCGAHATVERCMETGAFRVRCHRCHDRWCVPCQRSRAQTVAARLRAFIGRNPRVRLVTLTTRHMPGDRLAELLARLRDGFRVLRRRPFWRDNVRGGVAVVEVTHGQHGWHPHLHLIALGSYFPQAELSAQWQSITGSHVVDVRVVRSDTVGAYITKYLTKPAKPSVYRDPELLAEAVVALKGSRMVQTFGVVKAADLEPEDDEGEAADDTLTWIPLGRLDYVLSLPAEHPIRKEFALWLTATSPP